MRILFLLTDAYGSFGGMAQFNREILRVLCGHPEVSEVVAVPRLCSPEGEALPANLRYVTEGLNSKLKYIATLLKVGRSDPAFDLIVVGHLNLLPLMYVVRRRARAPVMLIVHGYEAWSRRNQSFRLMVRQVESVVSVSELTRDRFCKWSGFRADRVFVLPNGVDLNRFRPGPKNPQLLQRHGLQGRAVVMTLGRLSASERLKGFDEVLEIIPELARRIPDISYLIAGDGTDRARLEQKARSLGIADRVVFTGYVSEAEKPDYYRLADAYVMPSRGEGFGIVFLEALASGIPIVASVIDGSREVVREKNWGVVVDPDNPEEIKSGILEALSRRSGVRPSGLEYFSRTKFEERVHQIVGAMSDGRTKSE